MSSFSAVTVAVFLCLFAYTAQARTVITAFGDSLTAGYGVAPEHAFPVLLQAALREKGHDVTVLNQGLSGDTSSGGVDRLDWAMADEPQIVILELGANDALRGIPAAETRRNLDTMITRLKAQGRKVLLAGMLAPPNMGKAYGEAFNPIYQDLATQHDIPLYPFFLDGVAGEPSLNQRDGIHPTRDGVDIIVARILPYLERLINEQD